MINGIIKTITRPKNIALGIGLLMLGSWAVKNNKWSNRPNPEELKALVKNNATEMTVDLNGQELSPATHDATKDFNKAEGFADNKTDISTHDEPQQPEIVQKGGKTPPKPALNSEQLLKKVQSVDPDPNLRNRNYYSLIFLRTQLLTNDHLGSADLKTLNKVFEDSEELDRIEKSGGDARTAFHEKFYDNIVKLEGKISTVYPDSKNVPTIGIGFNMDKPDARLVWSKAFGKEVQKGDKTQIVDAIDFDDAYKGKVSLTDKQIDQLYEAGMFGFVDVYEDDNIYDGVVPDKNAPKTEKGFDGKDVAKRYPGYWEQMKNYVRPHAMEEVPYNVQFAMLSIIYQTPNTLSRNADDVKEIIDTFCDPKASKEDLVKAGSRLADIYETTLNKNEGPKGPVLAEGRWLEKYHLLCGKVEGAYPVKEEKLMDRIQKRLEVHGENTKHTKIILAGHLDRKFDANDLKALDNHGKDLTIYAPEENLIISMDKNKNLTYGNFDNTGQKPVPKSASSSP